MTATANDLLIVGSVAFDTLHIRGATHPKVLGGSATYAALAASHFAPVQVVAVVGNDFPDSAIGLLKQRKIDLGGLEVVDGKTFHWEGRYSEDLNSRETIRTDLNVFADFQPKIPAAYRSSPYVMLGNIDPRLQIDVLNQVDRPRLVVADTMNLWIDIRYSDLVELVKRVDVLVLNDEEARQLAGQANLVKAAEALRAMGPQTVIIKKGEHGASLFEAGGTFSLPALPLSGVADPTGAGDTFAGALIGYLARENATDGAALRRAIAYGAAMASFCVEGVSVERLATVQGAEVEDRFNALRSLVSF